MPKEFLDAVKVIRKYCQFEDCEFEYCDNCPYTLDVIRCGDKKEEDEK